MTAALAELSLGTTVQPEVLLDNQTALELAAIMDELSVLNPADSVKREAFYEVVRATPLLVVSEEALPAKALSTAAHTNSEVPRTLCSIDRREQARLP
jgi:hypothetical protein